MIIDIWCLEKIFKTLNKSRMSEVFNELLNINTKIGMKRYKKAVVNFERNSKEYPTIYNTPPEIDDYMPDDETIYEFKTDSVYMWHYNGVFDHIDIPHWNKKVFYDIQRIKTIEKYKIRCGIPVSNYEPNWHSLACHFGCHY